MSGQVLSISTNVADSLFQFQRNDDEYFDLPKTFVPHFTDQGPTRRVKTGDRLRQDGAEFEGDDTYNARPFTINFKQYSENDAIYRNSLNNLEGFFRKELKPFYLVDKESLIRAQIAIKGIKVKEQDGMRRKLGSGVISAIMLDGLWEDLNQTLIPMPNTEDGDYITLANGGTLVVNNSCNFNVFPVLYITPLDNVFQFTLENTTLDGGFEYTDNDFTSASDTGDVTGQLIMSSVDGSATINGVNKTQYISQGGFIYLAPGNNTLLYESDYGDIGISIRYRLRYAH